MFRSVSSGLLVGLLAVSMLSACGVRDEDLDLESETGDSGGSLLLGSDTSAIAGFWDTGFGLFVDISDDGVWNYIDEDDFDNCYNFTEHTLVNDGPTSGDNVNQYTIDEDGNVYSFNASVQTNGNLRIEVIGDASNTASYSPIVSFVVDDLQRCNGL